MSKISSVFQDLKDKNQKAFIPFITAGDGGMELTLELMHQLVDDGASIIELGVPFSDPMADGPVIAKSHERSVARGYGLVNVLELVSKFRETNDTTPIVLMGYLNPIEMFGYEDFANAARSAGVDGVLVVDMPPEESHKVLSQFTGNTGHVFNLGHGISPDVDPEHLKVLIDCVHEFRGKTSV